jgi:hypothetical protein
MGHILSDFLTNSSGHPENNAKGRIQKLVTALRNPNFKNV